MKRFPHKICDSFTGLQERAVVGRHLSEKHDGYPSVTQLISPSLLLDSQSVMTMVVQYIRGGLLQKQNKLFITEEDMPVGPLRPTFSGFGFATGLNQSKMTLNGLVPLSRHFGRNTDCFAHQSTSPKQKTMIMATSEFMLLDFLLFCGRQMLCTYFGGANYNKSKQNSEAFLTNFYGTGWLRQDDRCEKGFYICINCILDSPGKHLDEFISGFTL